MKKIFVLMVLAVPMLLLSCEDIFEEDIENRKIALLAPLESDTLEDQDISFLWREDDDISFYRFQLYESNSDYTQYQKLVTDTIMANYQYSVTLDTGNYLWRVRGENSEINRTEYTNFRELYVGSTSDIDITDEIIAPSNPSDENTTLYDDLDPDDDSVAVSFIWTKVTGASAYYFFLNNDNSFSTPFYSDTIFGADENELQINIPVGVDDWFWRVRAVNGSYRTDPFIFSFSTDTTDT